MLAREVEMSVFFAFSELRGVKVRVRFGNVGESVGAVLWSVG
jgi:hypothetical protein